MIDKYVAPAVDQTGFNCPHCGVRSVQTWGDLFTKRINDDGKPWIPTQEDMNGFFANAENGKIFPDLTKDLVQRRVNGDIFVERNDRKDIYCYEVANLFLATCNNCSEISIWMRDRMVYPHAGEIPAHEDLPPQTKKTFEEASRIVDLSPRAAAALARLAIQQLCNELGCKEKDIHKQIGELVARGLNPDVQKMLDAVRVIGNNAVHPGTIDVADDVKTARFLLTCINRICQRLITEKREAEELYGMLPEGAKAAIEKRDA